MDNKMTAEQALRVQGKPVAYAVFADNGNIRIWCADPVQVETLWQQYGEALQPLYTAPQTADQQLIADLRAEVEALKQGEKALEELVDLMEATRQGAYTPDSFTTQPARIALAAINAARQREVGG